MTETYPIPDFLHRQPQAVVAPRERPILFSEPMIRALLAGTKTQTRRVVKPQPEAWKCDDGHIHYAGKMPDGGYHDVEADGLGKFRATSPYGQPGDRLYVRENAWQRPDRTPKMMREGADTWPPFIYDADYPPAGLPWEERDNLKTWGWKRRPSIHLPRIGSRILLEIVAVRVERLQDISGADARAEGCPDKYVDGAEVASMNALSREWYGQLWESINGPGSWAANPWVWCLTFRRVTP